MPHTVTIDDTGERYACDQEESLLSAMARLGLTVTAEEVAAVKSAADFDDLIARALEARGQRA